MKNLRYKSKGNKDKAVMPAGIPASQSGATIDVMAKGLSVFEDSDKFNRWLHKKNKALLDKRPIDLLDTPTGINRISQVLGRIEEGTST